VLEVEVPGGAVVDLPVRVGDAPVALASEFAARHGLTHLKAVGLDSLIASSREEYIEAAVRLAKAAGYYSAGTVEFIVDQQDNFYFIEVNARIQVEHPVSEMVTGIDLVKAQIRVAAGERLRFKQRDIQISGHAIECRINAEDPYKFTPSPGRITSWHPPGGPGVRVDSHAYTNYFVPPNYDSMIGKVITFGDTRDQAIKRMRIALSEMVIEGIQTNLPLHRDLLADARFVAGGTSIHYLESKLAQRRG
jgi:acetyl-CoA carboxylase biotin carboxylase subunit